MFFKCIWTHSYNKNQIATDKSLLFKFKTQSEIDIKRSRDFEFRSTSQLLHLTGGIISRNIFENIVHSAILYYINYGLIKLHNTYNYCGMWVSLKIEK